MTWFNQKRTNGFVQDYSTAEALSPDRAVFFCVSERTAYLLQNLAILDIGLYHRYALDWNKNLYVPVEANTAESALVDRWKADAQKELMTMTCEDMVFNITVSGGGCGCRPGNQDDIVAPPEMEQGGATPDGWKVLDFGQIDKCKMAHILRDQLEAIFDQMNEWNMDTLFGAGVGTVQAMLATLLIEIAGGPMVWALTVIGAVSAVVAALIDFQIDFAELKAVVVDRASDVICAFYDSGDPQDAFDEVRLIFVDENVSAGSLAFFDALPTLRALALLFFLPEDGSEDWQVILDAHPVEDCSGCGGGAPGSFRWTEHGGDEMGTGEFRYDGVEFTLTSVLNTENGLYQLQAIASDPDGLGGSENCTNWDMVFISSTITAPEGVYNRRGNCITGETEGECDGTYPQSYTYPGSKPPALTHLNTQQFLWNSETSFTVTFRIDGIDEGGCP